MVLTQKPGIILLKLLLNCLVCLAVAWLEAKYWLDVERSSAQVLFKGLFMATFFTAMDELVLRRMKWFAKTDNGQQAGHT